MAVGAYPPILERMWVFCRGSRRGSRGQAAAPHSCPQGLDVLLPQLERSPLHVGMPNSCSMQCVTTFPHNCPHQSCSSSLRLPHTMPTGTDQESGRQCKPIVIYNFKSATVRGWFHGSTTRLYRTGTVLYSSATGNAWELGHTGTRF